MKTLIYMLLALAISALPVLAQGPGGPGPGGRNPGGFLDRMKTELNLSDQQVQQLQPLVNEQMQRDQARREAVVSQIDAVLTPEQKTLLTQQRPPEGRPQDGAKRPNPFANLNLTSDQQARIEQIVAEVRQQEGSERAAFETRLKAVLTADQQTRWQQLHQQRPH